MPGSAVTDCQLVCVPGQRFWHTHCCASCGSSWTHIAPTPMTQAKNREIHTCTKCGTEVYEFVREDEGSSSGSRWEWLAIGLAAGLAGAWLIDRRQ
jgi:hypothetical protein